MTEEYTPPYTATPLASGLDDPLTADTVLMPAGPAPSSASPSDGSTTEVAKDQAATVAQGTAEAGQHVAGVAKDQVAAVATEAGSQAKGLLAQARTELTTQAGQQQQRIAEGLRALGEELHSMTQHDGQSGVATDLAHQGAQRSQDIASWLDQREPGHLVEEVTAFARRKPGMFLLLAAGVGLAAGRLTRGVKDASSQEAESTGPGSGSPQHLLESATPASGGLMAGDVDEARPYASSEDGLSGFPVSGGVG
jgi:hypothetical protein